MYQLQLQQFSGPIEKLLELIEEKKLEITELNLAEVTADFLKYLQSLTVAIDPRILADFVVVASRLLLIKSKALLPNLELTAEEETDIKDLEERLLRYKKFKPAIILFKNLYEENYFSVSRQFFHGYPPVFHPAKNVDLNSLHQEIAKLFEYLNSLSLETQKIESPLIKLEEKIEEIIKQIEIGIGQFNEIIKQKSKTEIIVLFLALLHLLRDQIIKVEQRERFSDIMVEKSYDK